MQRSQTCGFGRIFLSAQVKVEDLFTPENFGEQISSSLQKWLLIGIKHKAELSFQLAHAANNIIPLRKGFCV